MNLIPSTRLGLTALSAAGLAVVAGGSIGGYAMAASNAPAASIPAANNQLYSCVTYNPATKVPRTIADAYTSKANFLAWLARQPGGKCPDSGFAVGLQGGAAGPAGPRGATGAQGPAGPSGLAGAYYSVAKYDVGDTNGGAVATVACKSATDVAISGGVQTLAAGTNGLQNNVPVSSSFPGRMDWSTNTPKPGDLSGWVVQFGGNSSSTNLGDPKYVDLYALCVPGASIPVDTTYTESGS